MCCWNDCAAEMTVLLKRQVAAQTHSPAMRQHSSWHPGASGRAGSFHYRKQEPGRAPKGRQQARQAPALQGHQGRGCQGAQPLHPGAGQLRPRAGGRRSFLSQREFSAGSRTLSPVAGCLPVLLLQEQPTHLWACWAAGIQAGQGGWWPRGGLAPGVGWPLVFTGWAGSATPLQTGSVTAAPSQRTDVGGKPGVP